MAEIARGVTTVVLAVLFLGMGVIHFVPSVSRGMAAMIPPYLRGEGVLKPINLVYLTGVCELAGGVGLLTPLRPLAAIALVVFLVAVFPANAYAAQHPEQFGRVAVPFWPRLAAQLALIGLLVFVAL
jgi:uncharacterized membrane protein